MTSIEYHRPKDLDQALESLKHGVPLAGGTRLTPGLRGVGGLVDLQDLGLDRSEVRDGVLEIGGAATLQSVVETYDPLPEALVQVCRLEAGWNIRNRATVAGTIVTGDGRSPLLTALLAMGTELALAPGDRRVALVEAIDARSTLFGRASSQLITEIKAALPAQLRYAQVARSPADRPQVCVAAALLDDGNMVRVALGGFASNPILIIQDGAADPQAAAQAAIEAYANASDQWASAEFRASVAGTLAGRVLGELLDE